MALATDLTAVTLEMNPFAYYRCNETTGTVLTDSGPSALNGTYNATTLGSTPLTTNDGSSPTFNGTTSAAATGVLASNAKITGANLSVSFWVNLTTLPSFGYFVDNSNPVGAGSIIGFAFYKGSNNLMTFSTRSSSAVSTVSALAIMAINTLYHVVGIVDSAANKIRLSINGLAQNTSTYIIPGTAANAVGIGDLITGPTSWVPGRISEVALFATALTAAQVSQLYYAGLHVQTPQQFWALGLLR